MFKVTALSVILAAMSIGNTFANAMDVDFTSMEMAVSKGTVQPYKLGFDVNLPDFVAEYRCEITLRANTMDNEQECLQTGGSQASKLAVEVEHPLPKVDNSGLLGFDRVIRKPSISGGLILAFTHLSEGQSEPDTFNVRMPVENLEKVGKTDNVFTYSSTKVIKGELIRGGNDGSNDAAEIDSAATFRDSQLNRAPVGGGSAIRNSRTIVEPETNSPWDDIDELRVPESFRADDDAESFSADDDVLEGFENAFEPEPEAATF